MEIVRAYARRSDPKPSHEAADRASRGLSELKTVIMRILWFNGPMNHEELVEHYYQAGYPFKKPTSIRSRCADLVKEGLVEEALQRRPQSDGTLVTAWKVVR